MADIKQAVKWMKEGRKVKHSDWEDDSYVCYNKDTLDFRSSSDREFEFSFHDFETNWEVRKEEKDMVLELIEKFKVHMTWDDENKYWMCPEENLKMFEQEVHSVFCTTSEAEDKDGN